METNKNFTTTGDGKTAGIVSYFTIIGWLIAYFAIHKDNKTELGSYQLRQTLLFAIVSTVLGWGLSILLTILIVSTNIASLGIIATIVQIGLFVLWIIGLIGAINGQKKPIPLIGEKAQTLFPGI
ncbi:DUF4870 domain-containing protein [Pedobacter sp. MC2016-05]|jgi:uncharacterized membrane protein|uniref:DUF4870 domain-containing protein n=1 Tax=unclassified Pedobacter TaxID=2628915 RepID=UPI00070293A1|nr:MULTISPECIES: hypothetical protein [unclassified Pedobacter]KQN33425.1 hypothetical protein ASE92_16655 [Pedobacter sp. Leaf41]MCX2475659.1 DUF4870 domain-containing protein [Pedobacter sp. MC2016-05]RZK67797.1 MAG: hypothetical protein EOO95_01800 [Pedobacter sp.]